MTIIIAVTIFLVAVISFGMVMKNFRNVSIKAQKQPVTPQPPLKKPEEEFKEILTVLIKLNLMIRKDMDFPEEMILNIEKIIDALKSIIPAMMEDYPGELLTYEIKKIGMSHLYKTVKEFLDLSADNRLNQLDNFNQTVQTLQDVTHRSQDIIENNEIAEFKTMAYFIAGKFSEPIS